MAIDWPMGLLACITIIVTQSGCNDAEAIIQPIRFSHAIHVGDNEVECSECHRSVESSQRAGRPGVEVCGSCHDVMLGSSEEEQRVVAYVEENREIPWRRLYQLNPAVFFSHARHVSVAGLDCQTCHGAMGEQDSPPPAALKTLHMNDCIDCHRTHLIRDDCNACHR